MARRLSNRPPQPDILDSDDPEVLRNVLKLLRDDHNRLQLALRSAEQRAATAERDAEQQYNDLLQHEYDRGHIDGWNDAIDQYGEEMRQLYDELDRYGRATTYAFGIAIAGFGNTPRTMLKTLSGKIAEATDRIESVIKRMEQITHRAIDNDPLMTESRTIRNALQAMYSGDDPTGDQLRTIATTINPMMARNALVDRVQLGPGVSKKSHIDRVCERAKPYRDQGLTFPECTDAVINDLYAIENPDNDTQAEIDWLDGLSDPAKSLQNNFARRYGKGT